MPDEAPAAQEQKHGVAKTNALSPEETTDMRSSDAKGLPGKPDPKKLKQASAVPSKRKANASHEPSKAPRRSARGAPQPSVDRRRMIEFLLSTDSIDLCRPKDEIEDLKRRGDIKTYSSSVFSPFEELVCAVILSRPISHALGLRSIRTIFNEPYNFTTPKALREAGPEGRRKALDEARTQHRQKTAEELGLLADRAVDTIGDGENDVSLDKVRRDGDHNAIKVLKLKASVFGYLLIHRQEREILKKSVKGLGKTGIDIFSRRIQGLWPTFYPFVDQKTSSALEKLGLPSEADELKEVLEENWEKIDVNTVEAADEEARKRKVFVRILERAVGADLEGNTDTVKAHIV